MRARRRARSILLNVLVALISTLLTAEAALRIYDQIRPSAVYYRQSYKRFMPNPTDPYYGGEINSLGFKDREFVRDRDPAVRIATIGDSFAFSVVPREAAFLTLVEKTFGDRGFDVEVMNFGIPGIGPLEYRKVLVEEVLGFAPDVVLLCFYIGNDFIETRNRGRRWYEYSHAASFARFLIVRGGDPAGARRRPRKHRKYDDEAPALVPQRFLAIERSRSYIYRIGSRRFEADVELAMGPLRDMQRICRRSGVELIVVLLPAEIQVDPELQGTVTQSIQGGESIRWDFAQPSRVLSERLATEGFTSLDLYDTFAQAPKTSRLYKPLDTHWNLRGNRLAAQAIAGFLAQRLSGSTRDEGA